MRKELQAKVDQLLEARREEGELHQGGRGDHHKASSILGKQVRHMFMFCLMIVNFINRVSCSDMSIKLHKLAVVY